VSEVGVSDRTIFVRWQDPEYSHSDLAALLPHSSGSELVAALLYQAGHQDIQSIGSFLSPRLSDLDDPFAITHVRAAAERIAWALKKRERVAIVGDYDVDGITSSALLSRVLRYFGVDPICFVPRRFDEGYGLSRSVLERALEESHADLLIALDCGTNSVSEVAFLREREVAVIIIDHHQSKDALPEDCLLVNPHVFDDQDKPWASLCTVGLVFKLVHALVKVLREESNPLAFEIDLREYLDLVSMGTVADLVPLSGENRILTLHGLKQLANSIHPGVQALFQISGIDEGQEIQPVDVSFKLGPRINASGRLADAARPLEMLMSDNYDAAFRVASELDTLNRERRLIENEVTKAAETWVVKNQVFTSSIVAYDPSWHSGVVGIVAGKLARRFHCPAIVLGQEGDLAKGSGRSIAGINLVEMLSGCDEFLDKWGGHPMAVGVSLRPGSLDDFRQAFNSAIEKSLESGLPERTLKIDYWLKPTMLQPFLWDELDCLRPFGEGNPEPILGLRGITITSQPIPFGAQHYRFQLPMATGKKLAGIAWGQAESMLPVNQPIDLALRFQWNYWNGRKIPQVELLNWRSHVRA
jgi:single-stranded-DNA-specific exonuclease